MVKVNKLHHPITVYTLYACNEWREKSSYGRQFMITDLLNFSIITLMARKRADLRIGKIQFKKVGNYHDSII